MPRTSKNVAMTLAVKHQTALSHQLGYNSFFRLAVEMAMVTLVLVTPFPENTQRALGQKIQKRITLTPKPCSVKDLISRLRNTLALEYNFTLQFWDPEFYNELCTMTDLSELPHKPTVKIIPVIELMLLSSSEMQIITQRNTEWYSKYSRYITDLQLNPGKENAMDWCLFGSNILCLCWIWASSSKCDPFEWWNTTKSDKGSEAYHSSKAGRDHILLQSITNCWWCTSRC